MKIISASILKKQVYGKRILVDTNIIIYLTDAIHPYDTLSRQLFEMIEIGDTFAYLSIVSIAEIMQGPIKRGDTQNAMDLKNYLLNFPNTACLEITTEVLDKMGKDSRIEWSRLRAADSLIIASGLVNDVDRIVSNDTHFQDAVSGKLVLSFESKN